jgi:hypothetical protein
MTAQAAGLAVVGRGPSSPEMWLGSGSYAFADLPARVAQAAPTAV